MGLEQISIEDDDAFLAWYGLLHASEHFEFPDDPGFLAVEVRAHVTDTPSHHGELYLLRDPRGAAVGSLGLGFPMRDNLHIGEMEVLAVAPEAHGRGHGRTLLEHGEQIVRQRGRSTVRADAVTPVPATATGERTERFARAAGYEVGLRSKRRGLSVAAGLERLSALEGATRHHGGDQYRFVSWRKSCPEELVADRAELGAGMSTDAPMDDLDFEPEKWDVNRVHEFEDVVVRMDRDLYGSGALDAENGRLVAFTELVVPRSAPVVGYQWDTFVSAEHRGRRLGTLVKLVNLRALAAASPGTDRIYTWNADSNRPMIDVNEAMGFTVRATGATWQKELA